MYNKSSVNKHIEINFNNDYNDNSKNQPFLLKYSPIYPRVVIVSNTYL